MCINPLTLKNKAYGYRLAALPFVECPCGSCIECQNVQKLDYLIRCIATYKSLPADKWSWFFTTLTFSEKTVPRAHFYTKSVIENQDPCCNLDGVDWYDLGVKRCFDHRLLHKFCKSFRQYYRRKFSRWHKELNPDTGRMYKVYDYVPKGDQLPHLLITCEFGEDDRYTHRPHYHMIAAVPERIGWKSFQNLVERFWPYGWNESIRFVTKDGQTYERSDYSAFEYVCKYVNKHTGYLPQYLKLKDVVCDIPFHNVVPRVFTTNGFGKFLENHLTDENYRTGKIRYDVNGKWREYLVPSYFLRRHFVNVETTRWKESRYVPPSPVAPAHYEDKVVSESRSEYTEEYATISIRRRIDKIKNSYTHTLSCFQSSEIFRNFLHENGCSYSLEDIVSAFGSVSKEEFVNKYLGATQFPGVARVYLQEPKGEDIFNNYMSDASYRKLLYLKHDQPDGKILHHIYSKIWLFDDVTVQIVASVIDYYNIFERQNREMRLIHKLKESLEYYKMHGIKKKV